MTESIPGAQTGGRWTVSARSFVATFALTFGAIAVLFVIDTVLAHRETVAVRAEARRLYDEGQRWRAARRYDRAIERLEGAVSMARGESTYLLSLGETELEAGRLPQAEATLGELLTRQGSDGAGNLAMARVYHRQGRLPEAIGYYHRAIYGRWDDGPTRSIEVRFELAELLASQRRTEDLEAELLALEGIAPEDPATRFRLGQLFIQAGDYRRARTELVSALAKAPGDSAARHALAVVGRALVLEPATRGVSDADRSRRAAELVRLTLARAVRCLGADSTSVPPAIAEARVRLAHPPSNGAPPISAEANLELAERLWLVSRPSCPLDNPIEDEALGLVMARSQR